MNTETTALVSSPPTKRPIKVFPIVVIVLGVLFIILFAVNVYQWNRIRNNLTETAPVARSEANVQFWLNLIWIFVVLALIAYAFYDLFAPKKPVAPTYVRVAKRPTMTPTMMTTGVMPSVIDNIPLYEAATANVGIANSCRI